jgi:hypothetical protein
MKIFKVRESASFGLLESLSLALYSAILAIVVFHHEATTETNPVLRDSSPDGEYVTLRGGDGIWF